MLPNLTQKVIDDHYSEDEMRGAIRHEYDVPSVTMNGDEMSVKLNIFSRETDYPDRIYYSILVDKAVNFKHNIYKKRGRREVVDYAEHEWREHPFLNMSMDMTSYNIRHCRVMHKINTSVILLEELHHPNNLEKYMIPNKHSEIKKNLYNIEITSLGIDCHDSFPITYNLVVNELYDNQLSLEITTNNPIPEHDFRWTSHFFRWVKDIHISKLCGVLNDTPLVRTMIDDLINIDDFNIQNGLVHSLECMFVNDEPKSMCQVVNDHINALVYLTV